MVEGQSYGYILRPRDPSLELGVSCYVIWPLALKLYEKVIVAWVHINNSGFNDQLIHKVFI